MITDPTHLLAAHAPGLSVTLNNGESGAGAKIRIRGGSSIGEGNDPLCVIAGTPVQNTETEARVYGIGGSPALGRNPLNAINPSDIASITMLRDARATAIYSCRGANDVALIETKRGQAGQASIEYETYAAFGQSASSPGVLTGCEYRAFVNQQVAAGPASQRMTECRRPPMQQLAHSSRRRTVVTARISLTLRLNDCFHFRSTSGNRRTSRSRRRASTSSRLTTALRTIVAMAKRSRSSSSRLCTSCDRLHRATTPPSRCPARVAYQADSV